jgi:serine/threonine protein phosphatase 1
MGRSVVLAWLRNRTAQVPPQSAAAPSIPPGMRVYAIGDIHGRIDLLQRIEYRITEDTQVTPADVRSTVVYLGDYIDRGPDSSAVIRHLMSRPPVAGTDIFLKGNHEQSLLDFLDDPNRIAAQWFDFGGIATLMSYGIREAPSKVQAEQFDELRDELAASIPKDQLTFLRSLKLFWELGDYYFVHAGIDPRQPMDRQGPESMLWIREEFTSALGPFGRRIVHGHTIVPAVELLPHRIAVDTGAYATGRLSCVVLEGTSVRILDTQ